MKPAFRTTELDSMNALRVQAERKAALYRRALELACNGDADQVAFYVSEADAALEADRTADDTAASGLAAAPAPQSADETISPALARQRRLVATLPQTREDAQALLAGHRDPWRVDLPDGAYLQLPGDPPGPSALRRVQNGIVYDVQPRTGRLLLAAKPNMNIPGGATTAIRTDGVVAAPAPNRCKLTECQGNPRCDKCLTMDRAYGMKGPEHG